MRYHLSVSPTSLQLICGSNDQYKKIYETPFSRGTRFLLRRAAIPLKRGWVYGIDRVEKTDIDPVSVIAGQTMMVFSPSLIDSNIVNVSLQKGPMVCRLPSIVKDQESAVVYNSWESSLGDPTADCTKPQEVKFIGIDTDSPTRECDHFSTKSECDSKMGTDFLRLCRWKQQKGGGCEAIPEEFRKRATMMTGGGELDREEMRKASAERAVDKAHAEARTWGWSGDLVPEETPTRCSRVNQADCGEERAKGIKTCRWNLKNRKCEELPNDKRLQATYSADQKYTVFIKPDCGFCIDALRLLHKNRCIYEIKNLHDSDGNSMEEYGEATRLLSYHFGITHTTVPLIFHHGKYVGGRDALSQYLASEEALNS